MKLGGKAYRLLAEKIDFFSSVDVLSMEEDHQVAVQPGQRVVMLKFDFTFKDPVWGEPGLLKHWGCRRNRHLRIA